MAEPRLVLLHVTPESDTTRFNVEYAPDGVAWVGFDPANASPSVPADIALTALDSGGNYLLDGVNSPGGNEAAASIGPWYRLRLKNAAGYGNWSLPFVVGWPSPDDVLAWLHAALRVPSGDTLPAYVTAPLGGLLAATIDAVESPIGENGAGGTGRSFTATPGTRYYDGTGGPLLEVDDLTPGAPLTVTLDGSPVTDAQLLGPQWPWQGSRFLARPNATPYALPGLWTPGYANVVVTGTWGYDSAIPIDLWDAVRGEVARRAVIQGNNDLAGVGETISIGSYSITTSSGISVWADSSILAIWQQAFKSAIMQFRLPELHRSRTPAGRR